MYKALVWSHLEFAGPIWNPYKKRLINDIELNQKKATKLIRYCKGMSYRERLMYLQLPTLKYRRFRSDMLEVYKILYDIYMIVKLFLFYHYILIHAHGVTLKLKVNRCNYDVRKYSFCNRVVNSWNSLSNFVVLSGSINIFKHNLDEYFIRESCRYYDYEVDPFEFSWLS